MSFGSSSPAGPSRPARPLSREDSGGASSSRNDSSNFLLTAAERKKLVAKEEKQANESCFSFLEDVKDKEGRRPDHPDYDPRTIFIPPKAWKQFTPFENQFWEIKQNHYDTVLFFQKGKFYELYENDASIGHQEFDLKLTDRVKMKMVGRRPKTGLTTRLVSQNSHSNSGLPSSWVQATRSARWSRRRQPLGMSTTSESPER